MDVYEELCRLAHNWEHQAQACDSVRLFGFSNDVEQATLSNRALALERCAHELRAAAGRLKESSQTVKQQTKCGAKPKS